jgi:hypothetical protein
MPFIFWRNIIFATFAATVVTLALILIVFQRNGSRLLARAISTLRSTR